MPFFTRRDLIANKNRCFIQKKRPFVCNDNDLKEVTASLSKKRTQSSIKSFTHPSIIQSERRSMESEPSLHATSRNNMSFAQERLLPPSPISVILSYPIPNLSTTTSPAQNAVADCIVSFMKLHGIKPMKGKFVIVKNLRNAWSRFQKNAQHIQKIR